MAAMPRLSSHAARCWVLRQFAGSVIGARTTMPLAYGVGASISSSFAPTFPTWGNVNVTIWPAYDGSVRISW
jgi:hypothetical protein